MEKYDPKKIEAKWQKYWEENPQLYAAQEDSGKDPSINSGQAKKYILDMFPYPSGDGLHVGHVESYTATDIISRYFRMSGKNVLHPQGWDAFGLPAENYAIKTGTHPNITTHKNIETFKRQIKSMGMSYDWSREINTSDPEYYKWTQWFFLLFYKNGLAYKKKAKVNWCESCQTVLANEQAEGGICERCKNPVIQKDLEQWFFKITDFIENNKNTSGLLQGLDKLDWPESIKSSQKNWISRSEGTQFKMRIAGSEKFIEVYTTRIDTVFGVTYAVIAPEHPIISNLKSKISNYDEVEKYIVQARSKTELERTELQKEKTGVKLDGIEVINPFTKESVPLFVADYVLGQYGTGAVMAVPAHDERDFEFAKKYDLPINEVIVPFFKVNFRTDKETKERNVTTAIIRNPKTNQILCLDWPRIGWKSFVSGGIEDGEDKVSSAKREVQEETGYKNIRYIKDIGTIYQSFYRPHKDSNVYGKFEYSLFELENDSLEIISEEELNQHKVVWIDEDKVSDFVNVAGPKFVWDNYYQKERSAFVEDGILINSEDYSGLTSADAREKMTAWLEKEGLGVKKINYRLRDWLVSRQRYWGAPIPIIYCEKCGEVPVPEKDLPVVLPTDVDFKPTGESPLANSKTFHDVRCPLCGGEARRESDTMDTFVCSSWYYFRYSDPKNMQEFASKEAIKKWLPVDLYVGGAEHAVLHLLYARFFTKVLHNLEYIDFDEPFLKLRNQGLIIAEDGRKMSKSLGNVVNPDQVVAQFGADSLRMFEMFMGPLEATKPWNTTGITGVERFLEKVWKLQSVISEQGAANNKIQTILHKTIKKVTEDIENFRFNTAISQLMILVNALEKEKQILVADYKLLITLLSPFAPHIAEEIWQEKLGHKESIFLQSWPEYDAELMKEEEIEMAVQVNGKLRDRIFVAVDVTEDEAKEMALESAKVQVFTQGKEIKKIIFVPKKLINIVIA